MPNKENITSPFVVIGAGRTASSYFVDILVKRGDTQGLIENTVVMDMKKMIFDSWWSDGWVYVYQDISELQDVAIKSTRHLLIDLFPSPKRYWTLKAIWELQDWNWFLKVFPDARFIHLVRDPRTNISSMIDFIQKDTKQPQWNFSYSCQKYLLSNKKALEIENLGVPYLRIKQEDFVDFPEKTWEKINNFLGLNSLSNIDYTVEINTSSNTTGKVKLKREAARFEWDDLPKEIVDMAVYLGYAPNKWKY